jgi:hypothetical protein
MQALLSNVGLGWSYIAIENFGENFILFLKDERWKMSDYRAIP